jgi:hypothetical protein
MTLIISTNQITWRNYNTHWAGVIRLEELSTKQRAIYYLDHSLIGLRGEDDYDYIFKATIQHRDQRLYVSDNKPNVVFTIID